MREISKQQVIEKIQVENPWWKPPHKIDSHSINFKPRGYFDLFFTQAKKRSPTRALILMGPRRVGKTIMVFQAIQKLILNGVAPYKLCYINFEIPLYNGLGIEQMMQLALEASGNAEQSGRFFFLDEIQYLRGWEVDLKTAVDSFPSVKFIASGSAAAALRLKSNESGAGRFTDFMLPPLTFYEYLDLLDKADLVDIANFSSSDLDSLNSSFVHYLNYGGYPEVIFSPEIQANPGQYIRQDIIDKVLLRDLPCLYGIQDIQELNSLFTTLAYNTAGEVSLEALSHNSGIAKNTIKRYIEYLEAAFLVKIVHRIDHSAKKFKRANFFKVYLTNPSLRSALFAPVLADDDAMGSLVETAVFAQWFHAPHFGIHYARWNGGEVDIVYLDPGKLKPIWLFEVKWSDRFEEDPKQLESLLHFCGLHPKCTASASTRTKTSIKKIDGIRIEFMPASIYCYQVGYNLIKNQAAFRSLSNPAYKQIEEAVPDEPGKGNEGARRV